MFSKNTLRVVMSLVFVLGIAFSSAVAVRAEEPAPSPEQAQFEIDFMKEMINHHASAIVMAEFCLKRAVHEELLAACGQMIEDQAHEIQVMTEWLQEWYGIKYHARLSVEDRRMIAQLVRHRGEAFEAHFMHMMIMHHSMAVEMSEMCLQMAYHAELLATCENIIATQTAEIEQMHMWLCEWYQHCDTANPMMWAWLNGSLAA